MKRITMIFAFCLCLAAAGGHAAPDQLSAEKRADIEKLLKVTGALTVGKQMSEAFIGQFTGALQVSRPDLPPELYDAIREEVNSVLQDSLPEFTELLVPVYHRHFSGDEIKQMIRFYQTDLGQKTIRVMPSLVQESMSIGQQWGQALVPKVERRVLQRFKAEGVDLST